MNVLFLIILKWIFTVQLNKFIMKTILKKLISNASGAQVKLIDNEWEYYSRKYGKEFMKHHHNRYDDISANDESIFYCLL